MYHHVSSSNQTTSMRNAVRFPVHMIVFDLLKNGHEGSQVQAMRSQQRNALRNHFPMPASSHGLSEDDQNLWGSFSSGMLMVDITLLGSTESLK